MKKIFLAVLITLLVFVTGFSLLKSGENRTTEQPVITNQPQPQEPPVQRVIINHRNTGQGHNPVSINSLMQEERVRQAVRDQQARDRYREVMTIKEAREPSVTINRNYHEHEHRHYRPWRVGQKRGY